MTPAGPVQPESSGSRINRARLVANSLNSVAGYCLTLPVSLLVSSFVVHRIGIGAFGIWATLTTILSYGSLLDLGITTPLVKYVAEYMALGRRTDVSVLISTAMVFYFVVGAVFLTVMVLAGNWILVRIFHASADNTSLRNLYLAVMVGFVTTLTFSVLESLIIGLQRADITARLGLLSSLLSSALIVLTLSLGWGVNGLAVSWITANLVIIGCNWIVAKRLFPVLRLNPFLFNFACLKRILRFSTKVQLSDLTLVLNDQVDRTLIAYVLGPTMLGFYALASRAGNALRSISFALMSGILPAASDLAAVKNESRLRNLYLRSTRYLAILDFGICAGVGGLARPLIEAWLGEGYGRVATTLIILMVTYAIWLPNQAVTDILYGVERPGIRLRADIVFLLVHIPLSVLLIWRFGYFGTILGTSFALCSTRVYVYIAGSRELGVPIAYVLRSSMLQPAVAALLALGATVLPQLAGAPRSLPVLVIEATGFCLIYSSYVALFAFDDHDRDLVKSHVPASVRRLLQRMYSAA